jgi:hypothetical protein
MSAPPMWFQWDGEAMIPRSRRAADERFVIGEFYRLGEIEEASEVSRSHQFVWLKEAWANLPDHLVAAYPSPEHLRKAALINTGWCTTTDYVCTSHAEAQRWATNLRREVSPYDVVEVSAGVVRVHRARSQKKGAMDRKDFQDSKNAILEWVAKLLEVDPAALERAKAA